jgi:hypothetical protein
VFAGGVHAFGLNEAGATTSMDSHNRGLIPDAVRVKVEALRRRYRGRCWSGGVANIVLM